MWLWNKLEIIIIKVYRGVCHLWQQIIEIDQEIMRVCVCILDIIKQI